MNSTGPTTQQGKSVSRMNALKTGIYARAEIVLPVEKAEDLQLLTEEYYDHYDPASPGERALVDALISNEWLLRRFRRIEGECLTYCLSDHRPNEPYLMAIAYRGWQEALD